MKVLAAVGLTVLFAALLAGVYLLHALTIPVAVVLYSAVLDALVATTLTLAVAFAFRRRLSLTGFEVLLLSAIWLLGGYAFAISGPTVLDRSLSFYILEKLAQRGGGVRSDAIEQVFVTEYVPEYRLVDVRLTEQTESGTIQIENGCVRLTERGRRIAATSRWIRLHLLPKRRVLDGEISDALVDPFAASKKGPVGYEC